MDWEILIFWHQSARDEARFLEKQQQNEDDGIPQDIDEENLDPWDAADKDTPPEPLDDIDREMMQTLGEIPTLGEIAEDFKED